MAQSLYEWCIEDDILYFKAKFHDSEFALQPLCKKDRLFEAIDKLKAYFNDKNIEFTLSGLEENMHLKIEKIIALIEKLSFQLIAMMMIMSIML